MSAKASIAARCRALFPTSVRLRGEARARDHHLILGERRPTTLDGITASGIGSPISTQTASTQRASTRYACRIDWRNAEHGRIGLRCGCPEFIAHGPCEHLWALLLLADERNVAESIAGTGRLDGHDINDDANEDRPADEQDPDEVLTTRAEDSASAEDSAFAETSASAEISAPVPAEASRAWSLWYVMNLQLCERQDAFVIEFFRGASDEKPLSKGPLRATRLSEASLDELHSDERSVVELMLRRQMADGSTMEYQPRRAQEQLSYAVITGDLCERIIPKLLRSGHMLARTNARALPAPGRPLRADDAPPLRLHLLMMERRSSWLLTASLVQEHANTKTVGERSWPLGSADLALSSGFVLRGDLLQQIDMQPGAKQWLEVLRKQNSIEVPHKDRRALLEFFAGYSGQVRLHLPAGLRLTDTVGVPQPCLLLRSLESYDGRHVEAQLSFDYAGKRTLDAERPAAWIDETESSITRRDFDLERTHRSFLSERGIAFVRGAETPSGQLPMEARLPLSQLLPDLSELAALGWRIELRNRRIAMASSSEWQVRSGVDWLELNGVLNFDSSSATLPELLAAVRRGESFVALADGSTGIIPKAWLARLDTMVRLGTAKEDGVRFRASQALLLDALLSERADEHIKARSDAAYRRRLQELRDGETSTPIDPPPTFQGELRPYQREGLGWFQFLQRMRIGGCLADDMGLGKTVQVLALLDSRRQQSPHRPSIVVVPKSLVFNWQQEAARFTPQLRVLAYVGAARRSLMTQVQHTDVVLTTYATLLRDIAHIKDIRFDYAILDEAQAIKNDESQSAKACRLLTADFRLAMSGTPVENHLGELWSLFEFLNPGLLGSVATFRSLAQVDSAEDLLALQRALRPFILRRTKKQVLPDLPEKSEQTLTCELVGDQRRQYDELLQHYRSTLLTKVRQTGIKTAQIHVLEALLRLRQAALHPALLSDEGGHGSSAKFDMLMEQLEDVLPQGHKALIFSQFTGLLSLLRERLDARGWSYAYLDGRTRDRQAAVQSFQEEPARQLFLISLRAGGHGLNLTAADYVFILDPWWNPAVEAQAIDRAHRIGQNRAVFAYRLIAADTIEEKIVQLQARKRELADAIITAENAVPTALTAEDLELLLG